MQAHAQRLVADPDDARPFGRELLQLVADGLPSGVVVVGPDGAIRLVNGALEDLFGYSRAELIGQTVELLLPEETRAGHEVDRLAFLTAPVERAMGAGRRLLARRRDGSRFQVEVGLNPIHGPEGVSVLAVVVDITARVEKERSQRRTLDEELELARLHAALSAEFINLPSEAVDDAIRAGLRRIGEALDLDRATFFRVQADGLLVDPVGWEGPGIPALAGGVPAEEHFPWALATIRTGQPVCFTRPDEIPNEVDRASYQAVGTRSCLTIPLSVEDRLLGAIGFNMVRAERAWTREVVGRLSTIAAAFGAILARRQSEDALNRTLDEVRHLTAQLEAENIYLRREVHERLSLGVVVGQSQAIRRVMEQVRQVAATDATVLLLGETGTGKELFASQIHELSARRSRPMVRVNCSAIPATLIESELFGREKGAYTGALARQIGRFELADRSTIFLDEIGELAPDVQVKLLRVLEERQIERLGSPRSIQVDTRIVAATHRDLERRILDGTFREDLFYRLNVFPIHVPPLRERVEDIPLLVWRFVEEFSKSFGKRIEAISRDDMAALQRYAWPGNIRELRNAVERAMIVAAGPRLSISPPATGSGPAPRSVRLIDVEKAHIRSVLESSGWRIRGSGGAAERLGMKPTTLETRMSKLGLKRPSH